MRRMFIHRHPNGLSTGTRVSWTRLRLAFANDSTATQNSSLRTIEEVLGAKLGLLNEKPHGVILRGFLTDLMFFSGVCT